VENLLHTNSHISEILVEAMPLFFILAVLVCLAVPMAIVLNICIQWLIDNVWDDVSK